MTKKDKVKRTGMKINTVFPDTSPTWDGIEKMGKELSNGFKIDGHTRLEDYKVIKVR
jgi:hypothetical protein